MKPIRLEDIVPATGEFSLSLFPGENFILRPFSLSDSSWMVQRFGGQKAIEEMFATVDMDKICIVVFRLLDKKDLFEAEEIEEYDDIGRKEKKLVTGPEKLKRSILGPNEQVKVLQALMKTIGVSQPDPSEAIESVKKKLGRPKSKPVTRKSST